MDIDLHDEETFAFDAQPEAFVRLDASPIVFTVRGIRYFKPRFDHIGTEISTLTTEAEFRSALYQWCLVEYELLRQKIESEAGKSHQATTHHVLLAAITGNEEDLRNVLAKVSHRSRAGLKAVPVLNNDLPRTDTN